MTSQSGNDTEQRIVVGVDGSAAAKAALAWTLTQAQLTGAVVEAVTAWDFASTHGYPEPLTNINCENLAFQVSDDAIAQADGSAAQVLVSRVVREGNAASVLLDESAGACLLVVGSRGSVGQRCLNHATCPVVIIPAPAVG